MFSPEKCGLRLLSDIASGKSGASVEHLLLCDETLDSPRKRARGVRSEARVTFADTTRVQVYQVPESDGTWDLTERHSNWEDDGVEADPLVAQRLWEAEVNTWVNRRVDRYGECRRVATEREPFHGECPLDAARRRGEGARCADAVPELVARAPTSAL